MDITLGLAARPRAVEFVTRVMFCLVELLGILSRIVLTQALVLVVYKAKELFCPVNFLKRSVLLACFK